MRRSLGVGLLIVGTVVGAGFASGREIVAFLGAGVSPLIAPFLGLGFFLLCVLFLSIGNRIKKTNIAEVNVVFLGKFHFIADAFLLLNSLVVLAGMLSAMDTLLGMIYPLSPLYSLLFGIISAVVVSRGLRAILKCNLFIVPLTILVLVFICLLDISSVCNPLPFSGYTIISSVLYISMNMMLACTFFVTISEIKKSTIIMGSAIAALIISTLIFLLISAINSGGVSAYPMPILELARRNSGILFYIGVIVIALSVFTTMLTAMSTLKSWVLGFGGGEVFSVTVVLIAGLIVSNLGFENVVAYIYPLIGIVGLFYITLGIVYIVRRGRRARGANERKRLDDKMLIRN